jgi:hypothetical protein
MRSLLLAMLSMSCACACDESQRVAAAMTAAVAPPTAAAAPVAATPAVAAAPASEPVVAAVDPREATRRAAHDVLAEHCGECHESHRPTAKPKALAIFDLDKPDWPARFDDHKYKAALMRLSSKGNAARDAFIAFREAELAAAKLN